MYKRRTLSLKYTDICLSNFLDSPKSLSVIDTSRGDGVCHDERSKIFYDEMFNIEFI